ncbi:MAG: formate/nitrite transporter family protein [Bacillales bacterium]|nr:formate/nitrite transporter family protein [Bacillales bacterium]
MKINWKIVVIRYLKVLLSAFLAGVMISLGGVAYIGFKAISHEVAGALLSSFGLMMVLLYGYNLFSAKMGYLLEENALYILEIVLSWFGNYLGAFVIGITLKGTRLLKDTSKFYLALKEIMEVKSNDDMISIFLISILTGIIIYLAVNTYKKAEQPIARFGSVILASCLISIIGLEETTIQVFLTSAYSPFNGVLSLNLVYITLGNAIGAIIIPSLNKLRSLMRTN